MVNPVGSKEEVNSRENSTGIWKSEPAKPIVGGDPVNKKEKPEGKEETEGKETQPTPEVEKKTDGPPQTGQEAHADSSNTGGRKKEGDVPPSGKTGTLSSPTAPGKDVKSKENKPPPKPGKEKNYQPVGPVESVPKDKTLPTPINTRVPNPLGSPQPVNTRKHKAIYQSPALAPPLG